ncbi:energy transducer TonB [Marivirga sp.]|uniref:energy transducer TonB n=1 Tax=Marivirga sp. TaxID=2018662 RepID=UPI002D7E8E33|nr:energy transducer TonB [Marivirga sp.]HET8861214.1 energy transducer TonB [Marivirga sp.]
MSDIKNVKLKISCPKSKESMDRTADGYNCSTCSKQVIDFTEKTNADFQRVMKSSDSTICGVFRPSQLSKTFLRYAAATAIASSSFILSAQAQHAVKSDSAEHVCKTVGDVLFGEVAGGENEEDYYYPDPIDGMEKYYAALMKNVNYPDSSNWEGRTYLQLTVDTASNISAVKVLKGFNKQADEEAVRAVKATPFPFKPANKNGIPNASKLIIVINFQKE